MCLAPGVGGGGLGGEILIRINEACSCLYPTLVLILQFHHAHFLIYLQNLPIMLNGRPVVATVFRALAGAVNTDGVAVTTYGVSALRVRTEEAVIAGCVVSGRRPSVGTCN